MFSRMILRQGPATRAVLSLSTTRTAASPLRHPSLLQGRFAPTTQALAPRTAFSRFYSTENQTDTSEKATSDESAKQNGTAEPTQDAEESFRKQLEEKQKEIVELKDKYVRSVADLLNLQERTKRDMENARNFAIQRFAVDLLESIDNFDRALLVVPEDKLKPAAAEANKDIVDLVNGLKMTQNILMSTLKKHGLERFDPSEPTEEGKRQKFDPNLHEATFMTKAENMEDGDIMYTQSKGFRLNGRVLRAAKVGVVKNT